MSEPVDTDTDGVLDYRDLDSDNDGLTDVDEVEGLDENKDGIADIEGDLVDGSAIPDADGDNVLDVLEVNNPALPVVVDAKGDVNRDTDGDGVIDSLDLDSDNDGILDIVEALGSDTNNDGRVDNAEDSDKDGLADVVDASVNTANNPLDENAGRPVSLLLIPDTDSDGKDDFQDVDSDNDGLSDLVEAGVPVNNDEDNNGMIDGGVDVNGIPIAITSIASPLDSDNDNRGDYRELDSDNDGKNDIVEAGGEDVNNDGLIDTPDELVAIEHLPDADNDGTPDYREFNAAPQPVVTPTEPTISVPDNNEPADIVRPDTRTADLSEPVTVEVLENDDGDLDISSVQIELPDGFMEAHPSAVLSEDGKRLFVPSQGTWTVNSDGSITYRAEEGSPIVDPTPISYSVATMDGTRLQTNASIVLKQSVVAGVSDTIDSEEICEDYTEESISIYDNWSLILIILLSSFFGVLLFRKERL